MKTTLAPITSSLLRRQLCAALGDILESLTTYTAQDERERVDLVEVVERVASNPMPFAARGSAVYQGADVVARTNSANMAKRIARALNEHKPDRRGQ